MQQNPSWLERFQALLFNSSRWLLWVIRCWTFVPNQQGSALVDHSPDMSGRLLSTGSLTHHTAQLILRSKVPFHSSTFFPARKKCFFPEEKRNIPCISKAWSWSFWDGCEIIALKFPCYLHDCRIFLRRLLSFPSTPVWASKSSQKLPNAHFNHSHTTHPTFTFSNSHIITFN